MFVKTRNIYNLNLRDNTIMLINDYVKIFLIASQNGFERKVQFLISYGHFNRITLKEDTSD